MPLRDAKDFASLVIPNGNGTRPIHQWFKYKEAFSADLVKCAFDTVLEPATLPATIKFLDPFCGVGTSLVSAQLLETPHSIEAIGIECNPFSAFVASAKLSWPEVDTDKLRLLADELLSSRPYASGGLPPLSSIRTGRCISKHMSARVIGMRERIHQLSSAPERNALLVGLAACIEPISKVRRDGRALRLVDKPRANFFPLLKERWRTIASDIEGLKNSPPRRVKAEVRLGDGRRPFSANVENDSIDLIITSPPYPNNIDYNEVYKLELWLLGFTLSADGFLALRRDTFRSHPTCSTANTEPDYAAFRALLEDGPFADLVGMVARRVSSFDGAAARSREKVLLGYLYDTWMTLQCHASVLKQGGWAIYVVGNSLHGGSSARPYLIPTDLIYACLGALVGLEVESVRIARPLSRRLTGNHFLRDSLVVLRKP